MKAALTSFLKALDDAIQRHVDATAFFFMRTFGVRKATLRLANSFAFALILLFDSLLPESYGVTSTDKMVGLLVGVGVLFAAARYFRTDVAAESVANVLSPVDAYLMMSGPLLKRIMAVAFAMNIYVFFTPEENVVLTHYHFHRLLLLLSWLFALIYIYLSATPSQAPHEEARETAGNHDLVPVPVRSRYRNDHH